MRITSLYIYGFGKFHDVQIEGISPQFQLIYGENEAGKSTMMAFIRSILFGFPTRQQKELRYEPKTANSYGGKITLATKKYGEVTIERVSGRATGDVTVYFPDGTKTGEEILPTLFSGIDRSLFQGIFSFDLNDLHSMEAIESEQLGKFLYGVGMSGRASIMQLEKKLQKEEELLFKRNGKKPLINQQLAKLEHWRENVQAMERKLAMYHELLEKKETLTNDLRTIAEEKQRQLERLQHLEKIKLLIPIVNKKQGLRYQLMKLPAINSFPADGLERYQELTFRLQNMKEQEKEVEKKIALHLKTFEDLSINESWLMYGERIKGFKDSTLVYEQLNTNQKKASAEIQKQKRELEYLFSSLGSDWTETEIIDCKTTIRAKEVLQEIVREERDVREHLQRIKIDVDGKQLALLEKEQRRKDVATKKLPPEKRFDLEHKQQLLLQEIKEKDLLEQEVRLLKTEETLYNEKRNMALYIILFLLTAIAIWSSISKQWLATILVILTVGILVFNLFYTTNHRTKTNKIKELRKEKERQLTDLLENKLEEALLTLEKRLKEDDQVQAQLYQLSNEETQEENALNLLQEKVTEWETKKKQIEQRLIAWCETFHFPVVSTSGEVLLEIVATAEKGKAIILFLKEKEQEVEKIISEQKAIEEEGRTLSGLLGLNEITDLKRLAEKALQMLENEKEKRRHKLSLQEQINELRNEKEIITEKINLLEAEQQQLFAKASVKSEAQFVQKGYDITNRKELEKELQQLEGQLFSICANEKEKEQLEKQIISNTKKLEADIQEGKSTVDELRQLEQQKHEQLAQTTFQIEELENGLSYSELLQQGEMKKSELQKSARQWAVYKAGQIILQKAKALYEEEKQPAVMAKAREYFSIMTGGRYVKLFAPVGKETFVVERDDGLRFTPEELSRGTVEQLYLSLRFALASAYQMYIPFPIIMDDILVNFDEKRKRGARNVMMKMMEEHQMIMLTCHKTIAELFGKEASLQLS